MESIKYSGNYSYESRIDLRNSQLATFLTSPSTSMTKLKGKFHYRYLYAQADTPTKMLQEVPVISNPLRGVRKYWAVRKVVLNPARPLSLYQDRAEEFPNPPYLEVSFLTSIPERFPYVGLPTNWFCLVLPSILALLWVLSSFPTPVPSCLSAIRADKQ